MTKKCTPDVVVMVPLPNKKVNCVFSDCICSYFHLITMLTLHDSTRLHGQLNVCRYMVELTTVLTFKEEKCDKRATTWIETSHQQYIIFSYEDNLCSRQIGEALGLHRQKRENKRRRLKETQFHLFSERNFYTSCFHGQEGKVSLEDARHASSCKRPTSSVIVFVFACLTERKSESRR